MPKIMRVCKDWYDIYQSQDFWRLMCLLWFPDNSSLVARATNSRKFSSRFDRRYVDENNEIQWVKLFQKGQKHKEEAKKRAIKKIRQDELRSFLWQIKPQCGTEASHSKVKLEKEYSGTDCTIYCNECDAEIWVTVRKPHEINDSSREFMLLGECVELRNGSYTGPFRYY
jgi:hypothetical protein